MSGERKTSQHTGARRWLAQAARAAGQPVGLATSRLRMLPDYLIVGAQRAGTTSLYNYLAQHPDVGRVRLGKGVHYFDTGSEHSLDWYRSHFPLDPKYVPLKRRPNHVGEGSPYYMFHPLALQRIHAALPDVRIIAILRDPVERAHSQWAHETARGFEALPFDDAVHAEAARLDGEVERLRSDPRAYSHAHQHQSYIARGQYAPQVREMWERFGKDRVLLIPAGELFSDPGGTYRDTLAFLGLEPFEATYEKHNARSYPPLDPSIAGWLEAQFAESNQWLVEQLGPRFEFRRG